VTRYAKDTDVPPERSRGEIERTLERYGASAFGYGWTERDAAIQFRIGGRYVKIVVPLPDPDETAFNAAGARMAASQARGAQEKAIRQRWRALLLFVKASLEAVECGIASFEDVFMAHIVLPDGSTLRETLGPQIEQAYETGRMPAGLTLALPAVSD
jgi:hypothetical protein